MKYNNGNGWKCGACDGALVPDDELGTCLGCTWRLAEREAINSANPFKGATGGALEEFTSAGASDEPTQEPTQDDVCVGPTRIAQLWFETLYELGVYAS